MRRAKLILFAAVAFGIFIFASFTPSLAISPQQDEEPSVHSIDTAQNTMLELTEEESAFLETHPVIRLGTNETWEPAVIKKADGTFKELEI